MDATSEPDSPSRYASLWIIAVVIGVFIYIEFPWIKIWNANLEKEFQSIEHEISLRGRRCAETSDLFADRLACIKQEALARAELQFTRSECHGLGLDRFFENAAHDSCVAHATYEFGREACRREKDERWATEIVTSYNRFLCDERRKWSKERLSRQVMSHFYTPPRIKR